MPPSGLGALFMYSSCEGDYTCGGCVFSRSPITRSLFYKLPKNCFCPNFLLWRSSWDLLVIYSHYGERHEGMWAYYRPMGAGERSLVPLPGRAIAVWRCWSGWRHPLEGYCANHIQFVDQQAGRLMTYRLAVWSTLTHSSEVRTLTDPVMRCIKVRCLHVIAGEDYRVTATTPAYDLLPAMGPSAGPPSLPHRAYCVCQTAGSSDVQ